MHSSGGCGLLGNSMNSFPASNHDMDSSSAGGPIAATSTHTQVQSSGNTLLNPQQQGGVHVHLPGNSQQHSANAADAGSIAAAASGSAAAVATGCQNFPQRSSRHPVSELTAAATATAAAPTSLPMAAVASGFECDRAADVSIDPAACGTAATLCHVAVATAAMQGDDAVVIHLDAPHDACRTASYSSTGTPQVHLWSHKPVSMQDSLAQQILKAQRAQEQALTTLIQIDLPESEVDQWNDQQQQQLDMQFRHELCAACVLKERLSSLSSVAGRSIFTFNTVRGSSIHRSQFHLHDHEHSGSAVVPCKECWQSTMQQLEKLEKLFAAQLTPAFKAEAQQQAMQASGYGAYALAVPGPSVSLCADGYTTWLAYNDQLTEDKAHHRRCYLQYKEAYARRLGQQVFKQRGSIQATGCLARLSSEASRCVGHATRPARRCVTAVIRELRWETVKQVPGRILFHISQLVLFVCQCFYVPLTVVLVPVLWVGRDIKTTMQYTAEWLWGVWKATVLSLVHLFATSLSVLFCLD